MDYDFGGWATKYGVKCADELVIDSGSFAGDNGKKVSLVWNHGHESVNNVLGHAILEHRAEGVYVYGKFNDSIQGQDAKLLVQSGDIEALSICASNLKKCSGHITHGVIREVSLVLAGCNPGAGIDPDTIKHSFFDDDYDDETGVIYNDCPVETPAELLHSCVNNKKSKDSKCDDSVDDDKKKEENKMFKEKEPKGKAEELNGEAEELNGEAEDDSNDDQTVGEVLDTLNTDQKKAVNILLAKAIENATKTDNKEGDDDTMKHNLFEGQKDSEILKHSMDDINMAVLDGKSKGSMKDSFIAHGITNIEYLFPEATTLRTTPDFISRDHGWVSNFMGKVHNTPFSRIKSVFANITADDARARGYIKGKKKVDEVFTLLKRTTTPATVYKKQKFDRDDIVDITDFDVVSWIKTEMRMMLNEELARACLIGDGRSPSSDDKINELNIRPIWTDDDLYTIKSLITLNSTDTAADKARAFIKACITSRKDYKGTGRPTLYAPMDIINECILLEDTTGRRIYNSIADLTTALNVSEIVDVAVMENCTRTVGAATHTLLGIIIDPVDYNIGADKGGAVNMFDDFDIDYNAMKYLIETRCSGAMVTPYGAIAIESTIAE